MIPLEKRAQAGVEFLAMMGVAIAMLAVALIVYSSYASEGASLRASLEAQGACQRTAALISASASLGNSSNLSLAMPKGECANCTIHVVPVRSLVRVEYFAKGEKKGYACRFTSTNVSNGAGAGTFVVGRNAVIRNLDGVLYVIG